jgi:hypothetical protein
VSKFQSFDELDTVLDGAEFRAVTPEDEAPVHTLPTNPPPSVPEEGLSAKLKKKRAHGSGEKSHGSSETHQTAVPVRTPDKSWFFRAHRSSDMQVPVDVLEIKGGKDDGIWFLSPDIEFPDELDTYIIPALLTRCITHDGTEYFYFAKQSDKAPKESSRRCVNEARNAWIRQRWNPSAKAYEFSYARQLRREPVWSNQTLDTLLELAFGDKFIVNASHEVVNRLLHPDDFDYAGPEPTE